MVGTALVCSSSANLGMSKPGCDPRFSLTDISYAVIVVCKSIPRKFPDSLSTLSKRKLFPTAGVRETSEWACCLPSSYIYSHNPTDCRTYRCHCMEL